MRLTRDTVLRRAPELTVDLAGSEVKVRAPGGKATGGPELLAALHLFSVPRSLADAVDRLVGDGHAPLDFVDASAAVLKLVEIEALEAAEGTLEHRLPDRATGFDDVAVHVRMLDDEERSLGYLRAIERTVRDGDVVVDLGTGTGLLAVAAARAGARRVFAIERTAIARSAEAVFAANGVADRVTLLRGVSSRVELPERADVLVTETFDNDLFGERALDYILDARQRFLKPSARLLPRRLRAFGELITLDTRTLSRQSFTAEGTERWLARYGIDFSPLAGAGRGGGRWFVAKRATAHGWQRLAPSVALADIDLASFRSPIVRERAAFVPDRDGYADGVVFWFEQDLGDGIVVSTRPALSEHSNWRCPVWLSPEPRPVEVGVEVAVELDVTVSGMVVALT